MEVGSLPVELWRVILAYLPLPDLGRCCQVCRAWRELIFSLDNTRWKQLCLGCPECRHPNWPSQPHLEPASWREALKQHALATRTWTQNGSDLQSSACLLFFHRRKDRRIWHVGPGCEFETLRGALGAVGPYDRVVLHPGVYEEQAEVALKVPVELVGLGQLGEVALLVCIEQQCTTARLCNLVFMPPWFSTVVYKTSRGHVQLDNCNFEGAQLQVRGPGTCQARFCSFSQGSSAHLLGVVLSLLDSCDFAGSDTASVTVEGPPVSERNWACKHLAALARTLPPCSEHVSIEDWQRKIGIHAVCHGTVIEDGWSDGERSEGEEENRGEGGTKNTKNPFTLDYKISYDHHGLSHLLKPRPNGSLPQTRCLFREGKGGVHLSNYGQARLEGSVFRGLHYAVRCIQNPAFSVICLFLSHCPQICNRIHSGLRSGVVVLGNGKGSIRSNQIYNNKEAGVYILFSGNPVVSGNHIFQGQAAGIAINENGRGMITENVIRENQWGGVDIRRGGDPILRDNHICYGYSDGMVVGERGRGLIEGNYVYCNKGCGVWVMSSSLPQLLGNYITHNCMYGLAVFLEGEGREGQENLNEEGELFAWESDLDSEDERHSARRSISVALVESNYISYNGAVGLYMKSSEPLNVFANLINRNHGTGIAVLQSSQLTRLVTNCILENGRGGVTVEKDCRVELRGNGIYENCGPGVSFTGNGQIVENDVVGNRGYGIQVSGNADIKVLRNRVQPAQGCGIAVLGPVKGVVYDNLLFQGHPGNKKTLIHLDPGNDGCVLRNNSILSLTSAPPWILENPPPRPLASPPSGLSSSQYPSRLGISMTTRISATVESGCHSGSMFCCIL
uniref:F-box domain-containing protein n=1 Tax=Monopterus albus TaxID=43700 RepID=A0A3Q3IJI6_MONAL